MKQNATKQFIIKQSATKYKYFIYYLLFIKYLK